MDVKTTFLNGVLKDEVFMTQLDRFILSKKTWLVCKLKKSIYRQKQSFRKSCHERTNSVLRVIHMIRRNFDANMYNMHKGGDIVLFMLYIDDPFVTSSNIKLIMW